ncbi:putative 5xTM membrane YitT family protein [Entomoplasma freundtii]|uniref:Uncharacterized protein n=1 Tax=Entomoplasma freundtii TaxID=74700 RepID=A0A2K8NT73_9MOLU|nr:YitT family ABC transporter [Entomoplasma freundtii]ATZ16378.1 hypothetical protein EFREU_v1c03520 [Entomoplasma freundtii]TDY56583.1 putative 5xTM membrane YitT family protein [Entomoplasma freundtii]
MRKITIHENYRKKIITLSDEEVEEIRNSPTFQKTKAGLITKAENNLMSAVYFKRAFWIDLLAIAFSALMTTIVLDYFISSTGRTGLFPGGLGSVTRLMAILTFPNNIKLQGSFYFIYYFLINIPLMIFSWIKLGWRFTITTMIYICFTILFDQLLNLIPVINPTEWHMIIDYPLLHKVSAEWNGAIWLFVLGFFGGVLIGWSYGLIYKVGSSTGGTDFITMYFSTKKNKNIGIINRNLNYIIAILMIIINSFTLSASDINSPIRMTVLSHLSENQINAIEPAAKAWWEANWQYLGLPEDFDSLWKDDLTFVFQTLASNNSFTGYTSSMVLLMQFKFIFGPSLFASIILITVQAMVIDAMYPKYKFRTIMITTSEDEKVKKFLFDSGYQNEIFEWNSSVESARQQIEKKTLIVTITVVNWKSLEKAVLNLNPDMNVNVLKTRSVKGRLNIELKDGRKEKFVHNKLMANKHLLKRLDDEALVKTIKKNIEMNRKKNLRAGKSNN